MDTLQAADTGIWTRAFSNRRNDLITDEVIAKLPQESQAGLRQFSVERLMAYGVHHADAVELRARVAFGERWQTVATDLAEECLAPPPGEIAPPSAVTRANRLYRASALIRMSQMMMLTNTDERYDIYRRAAQLYAEAAAITDDRFRREIDTRAGPVALWRYPAKTDKALARVIVIGGVEGWAMDFSEMGTTLSALGMEAILIDQPGQGETRMVLGTYLRRNWLDAYRDVIDVFEHEENLPLATVGLSMGGSFAIHLAANEPRILACCDNGGTSLPIGAKTMPVPYQRITAHCGDVGEAEVDAIWQTVKPVDPENPVRCPLLIVHGELDPLISKMDATHLFNSAASTDKTMAIYSDGDHCLYNHSDDKHALIGDWLTSRLTRG